MTRQVNDKNILNDFYATERDRMHENFIDRWARFVKENPKSWQSTHTKFINAQIDIHKNFLKRLKSTKNGRKKIIELYNIKNIAGYKKLLS